jgi:hypothetical protein
MSEDDARHPSGTPAGQHDESDRILVDKWIDGLSRTIDGRMSERELNRRLARITGRRSGLLERLSSALRIRTFRAEWRRRGERDTKALRRLDKALHDTSTTAPPVTATPSIEQIAYDLRRLDRQRRSQPTMQSQQWLAAVLHAYDQRLALACHALDLTEHLDGLAGMDKEIERVRVEAVLEDHGIPVSHHPI